MDVYKLLIFQKYNKKILHEINIIKYVYVITCKQKDSENKNVLFIKKPYYWFS